ncbi:MAG TPA: hypothetical protein PKE03_10145 [Bacteroidales bacterium]|nr:hypothetical protein [Bacteroidales bacterium]
MLTIFLLFVCGFLFLLFNECEDESVRNNWKGRYAWLNQRGSWKRKWRIVNNETVPFKPDYYSFSLAVSGQRIQFSFPVHWWYFGVYPENEERFPFSSTILVFLTDPEHMFQFLKLRMIELAFLVISWQACISWFVSTRLFALVKEKWLPNIS